MAKYIPCLLFLFFSASSFEIHSNLRTEWLAWKNKHNKVYESNVEEVYRFGVWTINYNKIKEHNAQNNRYTLAMNKFGDMTEEDFSKFVNPSGGGCFNPHEVDDPSLFFKPVVTNLKLPPSVDWSNSSKYVTPVKNQGSCGSCWAFSAVAATESRYAIENGVLNSLSEQELVDCSSNLGNSGCDGGFMDGAFMYIKENSGLALESEYVYTATDGTCESSKYTHYDPIEGFQLVARDDETALMTAVVNGPVSVGIQANQFAFQFYGSGILDGNCGTNIDHGVAVYGYNENSDGEYWIVKNSWGEDWGLNGYVYICRNCNKNDEKGECCINCQPSYPTISSTKINADVGKNN